MGADIITAVALYGPKAGALRALLTDVQAICRDTLGGAFRPYTLEQIHGTVIRLDGAADPHTGQLVNQRYLEITGQPQPMNLALALELLTGQLTPPLRIRLGGFAPGMPAAFRSRGQHPHERMFSAQGEALVLVGWPADTIRRGPPHQPLDDLRRRMNDANVMHWYHSSAADVDNDFHLVIGHQQGAPPDAVAVAVRAARAYLAQHQAEVAVGPEQVSVIASQSPTLVPARFAGRLPVDPAAVASLYR